MIDLSGIVAGFGLLVIPCINLYFSDYPSLHPLPERKRKAVAVVLLIISVGLILFSLTI